MASIPEDIFFASISEINGKLKAKEFSDVELIRAFTALYTGARKMKIVASAFSAPSRLMMWTRSPSWSKRRAAKSPFPR